MYILCTQADRDLLLADQALLKDLRELEKELTHKGEREVMEVKQINNSLAQLEQEWKPRIFFWLQIISPLFL